MMTLGEEVKTIIPFSFIVRFLVFVAANNNDGSVISVALDG